MLFYIIKRALGVSKNAYILDSTVITQRYSALLAINQTPEPFKYPFSQYFKKILSLQEQVQVQTVSYGH